MLKLEDLIADQRTVEIVVEAGGEAERLKVTYRPSVATPAWLAKTAIPDDATQAVGLMILARSMVDLVVGWDLTEDGKPIPIDTDTLINKVPYWLLLLVRNEINADVGKLMARAK